MNDNLIFGGGVSATTMNPLVILVVLIGAVAILFTGRRTTLVIVLSMVFLIPSKEQIYIWGAHLYTVRILAIAGIVRLITIRNIAGRHVFSSKLGPVDIVFFLWVFSRGFALILDYRQLGAVISEVAFWIDAAGGYLLLRHLIQTRDDVIWATKVLAVVVSIVAIGMAYESITQVNLFNYIDTRPTLVLFRNGRPRAQGPFANSITAGVFGAVLAPLFYWLWRFGGSKTLGLVAFTAAVLNVLTSLATTAALTLVGGLMALALWPARAHLAQIRKGIVMVVIMLALAMRAPVWFLIARANVVGGSNGWDRAYLIDATIRHFWSWWLIGTQARATWGYDTWDACNQFVLEATDGGLVTLILFVTLLVLCFSLIGRTRRRAKNDRALRWFYWCIGAALFANLLAFIGVDYFDQIFVEWLVFLAIITAAARPFSLEDATSHAAAHPESGKVTEVSSTLIPARRPDVQRFPSM